MDARPDVGSNPWPRLVLVEGLPGSGKSSTAQWIAHELTRQGRAARWVYEQEVPHPVLGAAIGPWPSWRAWLGDHLTAWARFAAAAATSETATVVESTFLQTTVWSTLRRGLDPHTILLYVDRLADLLRPVQPALVYFHERDPDTALRGLVERRGMVWTLSHIATCDGSAWARARRATGLAGLLAYSREHARVCDDAVGRAQLRLLTVETSLDWPERRRRIAEFLGLPWPPPSAAACDLAPLVGRYRGPGGREAHLSLRGGELVLDRLLWRNNRLLSRGPGILVPEGWPFTLTFENGASGAAERFRLDGPGLARGGMAGVYERLPEG
jgi:hypothetical protein